ncbi:MAG: 50S ribosomal protein L15 [Phycisphaerae bacterium]|nr:50S ribosomal protein L15 [Phycisphaerae bacterium]
MKLDEILSAAGKHKRRKRIGRGIGSGMGKTSGRGHKGYGSRSGAKKRLGYEGGQTPMLSRIPKRGFNNANFRTEYQVINVAALEEQFEDGSRVDAEALKNARMIDDTSTLIKILGNGDIKKKLTVVANKFSATAKEKISQAGGTVEEA